MLRIVGRQTLRHRPLLAVGMSARSPVVPSIRSAGNSTTSVATPTTPPNSVWAWCEHNPITFGVGFATVKTAAADLLTQKAIEGKEWKDVDTRRLGLFTLFGFGYMGETNYSVVLM